MGKVRSMPLKVQSRSLNQVEPDEIEHNGVETILFAKSPHIKFIVLIYPEGGAWYS